MKEKDINSLDHTTWRCQYHIVFAPKYRRMAIYGEIKVDIGKILRQLCQQKGIEIIEAELCRDHVHMLISIPPKYSVSQIMGYKAKYTRIAENAKESIRVLKEKLADVLENRSERNRWISHFTQFSTMETLDRKAVVHMIQSIKVIGKKELEITFTYQDEYQKAIQLIQLAEQTSQRKVG